MESIRIELIPLDFQSNVRTSYTKIPYVPADGLEPPNSEERRFTVSSNCRYAIQAFVEDIGFEPMTLWM